MLKIMRKKEGWNPNIYKCKYCHSWHITGKPQNLHKRKDINRKVEKRLDNKDPITIDKH